MRTFTFADNSGKTMTVTEAELKSVEYDFPIMDGQGYYRVTRIPTGRNPIVTLKTVGKKMVTRNGYTYDANEYGNDVPEQFVRLAELAGMYRHIQSLKKYDEELKERAKDLKTDGTEYFLSHHRNTGTMVRVVSVSVRERTAKVRIQSYVGDFRQYDKEFYAIGKIIEVGVQNLYDSVEVYRKKFDSQWF